MSLIKTNNAKIRIVGGKLSTGANLEPASTFWSGWSSPPVYTFTGTAVFSTNGNVLKVTPRSGLLRFDSNNQNCGGSLDASNCTNLERLFCINNQLTTLNVSGSTNIDWITCRDNQLTTLDVSGLTKLKNLGISNNQLTLTAVNNILTTINGFGTSIGTISLHGGTNAAPTGAGLTAKAALQSRGWTVTTN